MIGMKWSISVLDQFDVTTLLLTSVRLKQKEIVFLVTEIDQLGIKTKDITSISGVRIEREKNVVIKIIFKYFL